MISFFFSIFTSFFSWKIPPSTSVYCQHCVIACLRARSLCLILLTYHYKCFVDIASCCCCCCWKISPNCYGAHHKYRRTHKMYAWVCVSNIHTQLDLILKSEEGGDISDFITNGEWFLIGKYCILTLWNLIFFNLSLFYYLHSSLASSLALSAPFSHYSVHLFVRATFGSVTLNLSNPLNSRVSFKLLLFRIYLIPI